MYMGADFLNRIRARKPSGISEEQLNRLKTIEKIEQDIKEQQKKYKLNKKEEKER